MGLAPVLVQRSFELIQQINRQGTTILMVEQNANMALSIAHRGYVLQTGRLALADTAANLLQQRDDAQGVPGNIMNGRMDMPGHDVYQDSAS